MAAGLELISPEMVLHAFRLGAFPMGDEDGSVSWFRPARRALFPIEGIRVSRSLARTLRRGTFEVRFDTAFPDVVWACRRPKDNWINRPILETYAEIHRRGWAHCVECWEGGELVGGSYGIAVGGVFSAESMFHRRTDASKVALYSLVERCRELGFTVFDAQILNPHLASLGAYEVSHMEYMVRMHGALATETEWSYRP